MHLGSTWLVGLLSVTALAGPRTLLLGGGDCADPELAVHVRAFNQKLQPRLGSSMVELDAVSQKLRPVTRASVEEIRRQLEAAQAHYFSSHFRKAEEVLAVALGDAALLPPSPERVKLQTDGWMFRMLLAREQRQTELRNEAINRVLRLQPDYKPDPLFYQPSVRQEFEAQRARFKQLPSAELNVRSSPSGADVYLDGVLVGRTPLKTEVLQGGYSLLVKKGKQVSFPRSVEVRGATAAQVDLDFEGTVETRPTPCLAETAPEVLMTKAVRLGSLMDVEQVVILTVQPVEAGPSWVTALVVSVERGQRTREAGFKARGELQTERALDELADYVATGQASRNVIVAKESSTPAPWSPARAVAQPASSAPGLKLPQEGVRRWLLWGGVGAVGTGLLGAGAIRLVAQGEMDALRARSTEQGVLISGDARADELRRSLELKGAVIAGLLGVAGAGVATAAGALFWPAGEERMEVGVWLGPGGGSAWVEGRF